MQLVIIESPLAASTPAGFARNQRYARLCVLDSLFRGEAPFASHLLYAHPDILDDARPEHRRLGMLAGFAWGRRADLCAAYVDLDVSDGMIEGIERAKRLHIPVEYRGLEGDLLARFGA